MKNPKVKAWLSLIVTFALIGLALFLSAGTIRYWRAWVYLGVGAASSVPLTLYIVNDPILLANRSKAGPAAEQRLTQKIIVIAHSVCPASQHSSCRGSIIVSAGRACRLGSP